MTVSNDRSTDTAAGGAGSIEADLLSYLEARTKKSWEPELDLFAAGGLSSLFAMELVVHLEKTFGISIGGADLRLDNFRTVRQMGELVRRLQASASGAGGE
ncbi:acyl carrier protein [Kitasatospora sp. NBC_00458]|uniref:acyl carrier protein n=1 Tax=Kitasatospora sp. NBC_00458 TaxID=2903568 RepID=UPI002E189E60